MAVAAVPLKTIQLAVTRGIANTLHSDFLTFIHQHALRKLYSLEGGGRGLSPNLAPIGISHCNNNRLSVCR